MTVLTRWDPFREFNTLQDRMNRLFRDSFGEGGEQALTTSSFAPAVDVYEDEHSVTLKIEVPGIDEKDIDVRIENNTLTVHGERKFEKERKEENFRRVGAAVWKLHSLLHATQHGRSGAGNRQLRQGRAEDQARQESRSQAEADQSQRWQRAHPGRQRKR